MWLVRGLWLYGRPSVFVRIVLPRLGVSTYGVTCLLDTGADSTTVHWQDRLLFKTARREPLPPDTEFAERMVSRGIGDISVEYGREQAHVMFLTDQGQWLMANDPIAVNIAMHPDNGLPSLLGQDLLRKVRVDLNAPQNELILQWPPGTAHVQRDP